MISIRFSNFQQLAFFFSSGSEVSEMRGGHSHRNEGKTGKVGLFSAIIISRVPVRDVSGSGVFRLTLIPHVFHQRLFAP